MSEAATNKFEQALKILMDDLNVTGWDQPHKFYLIMGDPDDPTFQFLCNVPLEDHPADFLQFMYHMSKGIGINPIPPNGIGLLLVNEGWRHLTLEEAEVADPEGIGRLRQNAPSDTDFRKAFSRALMRYNPSDFGPDKRREVRVLTAVFTDGSTPVGAYYDRLDGRYRSSQDDDVDHIGGRIPDVMARFVTGQEPEPEPERSKWDTPAISELLKRGSK